MEIPWAVQGLCGPGRKVLVGFQGARTKLPGHRPPHPTPVEQEAGRVKYQKSYLPHQKQSIRWDQLKINYLIKKTILPRALWDRAGFLLVPS